MATSDVNDRFTDPNGTSGTNTSQPAPPTALVMKAYKSFNEETDIVENQIEYVTAGIWSNNEGSLITYYTSSGQTTNQKRYYLEIFQSESYADNAEAQFSLAFGHVWGSGSTITNYDYPTKATYTQYKNILNDDLNSAISVGGTESDFYYFVNINRSRYRNKIDPGNWEINLAKLDGAFAPDGSGDVYTFIDDSGDTSQTVYSSRATGRVYSLVSGSLSDGIYNLAAYGLAYPDLGILLFDGPMLDTYVGFGTETGSNVEGENAKKMFAAMDAAKDIDSNYAFTARNVERITSNHYFVRVMNGEFNFSNNPTFYVTESNGDRPYGSIRHIDMIGDPKTFLTTIGLYDSRNRLLAVAKTSQPILKSYSNEALVKVKLDF